ncbi:hypothetical protein L1987_01777 [Smallanthus sonchifolius]|uniref:Uncharacterized protein n=1 Tax=Smallanthus sonchifolius TaxID=185202 RepID=A0ACB9K619_9ASTR|nr:hypothetical protein L1987_01777 [Smallanthus sonchifolius]
MHHRIYSLAPLERATTPPPEAASSSPENFLNQWVGVEEVEVTNSNMKRFKIFSAGGKRMRPTLVFLVSRATLGLTDLEGLTRQHRRLAEIIGMIHTASLIHDDVLDESDMRREC